METNEEPKKKKSYHYLVGTGRPTKFRKEYTDELIKFFNETPYRKEVMEVVTEYKSDGEVRKSAEKFKHVPNYFPTLIQFAMKIKVNYFSLVTWAERGSDPLLEEKLAKKESYSEKDKELAKELKKFAEAYKMVKELQQDFLVQNGLNGSSPAAAFIFTAKNVTKMRDKVENDVRVTEVKPLLENLNLNDTSTRQAVEDAESLGS